jgi:Tol biopolymer transport system component
MLLIVITNLKVMLANANSSRTFRAVGRTRYNSLMRWKRWIALIAILIVLVGAAVGFWLAAPRLLSIMPASGSRDVPLDVPLELVFSQPIDPQTVELELQPALSGSLSGSGERLTFTPAQDWPSGATITATLKSGARTAAFPGLPLMQSTTWSFRTRQVLLAYLWPASGFADLYALNTASGKVYRLTVDAAVRDFAAPTAASQDRKWIYYTADKLTGGSLILRLDLAALEDQPDQPLPFETVLDCEGATCASPATSPDGRYLAYERAPLAASGDTAQVAVWVLDLQTGTTQPVASLAEFTRYPAWSPLGQLALYNRTRTAYQIFSPANFSAPLFELPHQTSEPAIWRPDGSALLAPEVVEEVTVLLDTTISGHLLLYAAKSPLAVTDLTVAHDLEDTSPAFSPDGSQVAFARRYVDLQRWTVGRQLWVMQLDGSNARQLTDDPFFNHYAFAWSPDGRQIAYLRSDQSNLSQPLELWVVGVDGSNPLQLVIGGFAPQWIP